MKRVFILLLIAVSFGELANAQKLFSKEWKQWATGKDSASIAKREAASIARRDAAKIAGIEAEKKAGDAMYFKNETSPVIINSNLEYAGIFLEKSAKFQYSAIGCAAVSTGLLIGYGSMSDKFELGDDKKAQLTSTAKALLVGGGVMAFVAIILEINAIECKSKAGKCLRMQSTENGAGLAYVF